MLPSGAADRYVRGYWQQRYERNVDRGEGRRRVTLQA